MDENCLHLTVVAPRDASYAPVMVWLHGGAYISGGGDLDCYLPHDLVQKGLVCVNVSYRLGVFGYLMIPGISPANLGLLDQIMALQWIKDEISSFGGDPANVTLVGQSAGADSIICLSVTEAAKHLFHKAILMSPPLRELRERAGTVALLAERCQTLLTANPREMAIPDLLQLQKQLLMKPVRDQIMLFGPSLGHHPLPKLCDFDDHLNAALRDKPILIGWTAQDGRPFASMMGPFRSLYGVPLVGSYLESLGTWFVTASYFSWPSRTLHEQIRTKAYGHSTTYAFEWHPLGNALQANHCIDIPFVLGTEDAWKNAPMLKGDDPGMRRREISGNLQRLWVEFMKGRRLKPDHICIDATWSLSDDIWET